jgi:hypothetical protein
MPGRLMKGNDYRLIKLIGFSRISYRCSIQAGLTSVIIHDYSFTIII